MPGISRQTNPNQVWPHFPAGESRPRLHCWGPCQGPTLAISPLTRRRYAQSQKQWGEECCRSTPIGASPRSRRKKEPRLFSAERVSLANPSIQGCWRGATDSNPKGCSYNPQARIGSLQDHHCFLNFFHPLQLWTNLGRHKTLSLEEFSTFSPRDAELANTYNRKPVCKYPHDRIQYPLHSTKYCPHHHWHFKRCHLLGHDKSIHWEPAIMKTFLPS